MCRHQRRLITVISVRYQIPSASTRKQTCGAPRHCLFEGGRANQLFRHHNDLALDFQMCFFQLFREEKSHGTRGHSAPATRTNSPQTLAPLEAVHVARHLTWSPRRLKSCQFWFAGLLHGPGPRDRRACHHRVSAVPLG